MSSMPRRRVRGLTLIEVMVVVAIIAILSKVALPTYASYMNKSRAKSAAADLSALALNMENKYQLALTYPVYTAAAPTATTFPGWQASQAAYFSYAVTSTASSYTVTATASSGTCTLTLNNSGTKTGTSGCGFTSW